MLHNPVHSLDNIKKDDEYQEFSSKLGDIAWVWIDGPNGAERIPWVVFIRRGRKQLKKLKAAIERNKT